MEIILFLVFALVFILVMRAVGAWMLRINELISNQEKLIKLQQKQVEILNKNKQ